MTDRRYAVYLAPRQDSRLWHCGCSWLGRDAATDTPLPQPDLTTIAGVDLEAVTATPRRYGFHATLKAPFFLREDATERQLVLAMEALGSRHHAFSMSLEVGELDGFIALLPSDHAVALALLAADCVRDLDAFRTPLTDAARRHRGAADLSPRHHALLEQWGYPYVMEAFRFHMTLSERLPDAPRRQLHAAAARHFSVTLDTEPLPVDSICLFREATPGGAFRLAHRVQLNPQTIAPRELV